MVLSSVSFLKTVKSLIYLALASDNKYDFIAGFGCMLESLFLEDVSINTVTSSGMIMGFTWKYYIIQIKPVAENMASACNAWKDDIFYDAAANNMDWGLNGVLERFQGMEDH